MPLYGGTAPDNPDADKPRDAGLVFLLSLHPQEGQGIDMAFDTKLLHIFSRLLHEAVQRAD
ncbi:MAG: hypothetical protein HYU76_06020 [Betaproteobacteria bacterium]|nr:hypothetical protein [Betaproteobacteria bacterium]